MKSQQFCEPQGGKLAHQLPRDLTFAYILHLGCSRGCFKGLRKQQNSEKGLYHSFGYDESQYCF